MQSELPALLALSVACDVCGQISFKLGAMDAPPAAASPIPPAGWIAAGFLVYVLETFVWLKVLAIAPLTLAAPIASLNYIGVNLMSRWLLSERLTKRQWLGTLLITLGATAVAISEG